MQTWHLQMLGAVAGLFAVLVFAIRWNRRRARKLAAFAASRSWSFQPSDQGAAAELVRRALRSVGEAFKTDEFRWFAVSNLAGSGAGVFLFDVQHGAVQSGGTGPASRMGVLVESRRFSARMPVDVQARAQRISSAALSELLSSVSGGSADGLNGSDPEIGLLHLWIWENRAFVLTARHAEPEAWAKAVEFASRLMERLEAG